MQEQDVHQQDVRRRILFVDDEPKVLEGFERLLHDHTSVWNMTFLDEAAPTMAVVERERPEVVVLDISMPGLGGLELLAQIKGRPETRDIEVVMLTGLKDTDLKRQALDLGATDLLTKPVVREDLVARLNSALRVRAYGEELRARNASLEEQLMRSQRLEIVGTLAAGVAHDLRNMLAAILGHSELTQRIAPAEAGIHEHIGRIQAAGQRAKKLVQQIVRFVAAGEPVREPCALGKIVTECLDLVRPTLPAAVDVVWPGPRTKALVHADATQMFQVVMNLCLNAAEAMRHGGTLTVTLEDAGADAAPGAPGEPERSERYLRLDVTDTGVGMDEVASDCVFEPLLSIPVSHGTGLGLSVVSRIVESHHGWVSVKSALGAGSTFSVHLPAVEQAGQAVLTTTGEVPNVER